MCVNMIEEEEEEKEDDETTEKEIHIYNDERRRDRINDK
jgi:hypothetical protein